MAAARAETIARTATSTALGVSIDDVDLVEVRCASPLLVQAILREGRLLIDRDPQARMTWQEGHLHRYVEAMHLRELAMVARAERLA